MNDTPISRRIHILRDSVAKRIAAGEVIDRPFSVVRELLDNAIDAGARSIDLHLERGGLDRIRVVDDGAGMEREDLELCWQAHATSKIESAEDIYALATLGFRGEALSSVASCARLTITSAAGESTPHTLEIHGGKKLRLEPASGTAGTTVDVADLFFNMPGRRRFLKSAGAESSACRKTLLEKALPFPAIAFRLFIDGQLRLYLPPASLRERVAQAHPSALPEEFLYEREEEAGRFSLQTVLSSPSLSRRDRRHIHIYINRRRIAEYSLVQAVQYAYGEYLPGGQFPAAFIFARVDPELVDFNIHPAKREARIKNLPEIHHQLVHLIGRFLAEQFPHRPSATADKATGNERPHAARQSEHEREFAWDSGDDREHARDTGRRAEETTAPSKIGYSIADFRHYTGEGGSAGSASPGGASPGKGERPAAGTGVELERWKQIGKHYAPSQASGSPPEHEGLRLLGQFFELFIAVEYEDALYLIDQHAAHERIIYDRISAPEQHHQSLLVPLGFDTEEEESRLLAQRQEEFAALGIGLRRAGEQSWELTAVPERCTGMEEELIDFLQAATVPGETLRSALFADLACKAAVKDGERLDAVSAAELSRQALALPVPRCPHGRPVWHRIAREELLHAVGRL